ncbi:MAG TPA: DUF1844 domain-containing protein [Candidatus Hydrogenedentes bacterium]|nr:DUF1844 domain-containing protein [Candidatus Hydrogenedentota bacterium]
MADDQSKIIIDEDWKEKVRREKEEVDKKTSEKPPQGTPASEEAQEQAMPDPTFSTLLNTLSMQAMIALGVIAPREAQQVYIDLDQAKFAIDLIIMLRDKTKGNLSPEEEGEITAAIADLQNVYVARVQQYQDHLMRNAGLGPDKLRNP